MFVSLGAPPVVRIASPTGDVRQRQDAPLLLAGQAYDDKARELTGARLRWFAGRRLLGTGKRVTVRGLAAGRPAIRLEATDSARRRASIVVRPHLVAVRPVLLGLRAPKTIARRARSVVLRVRANVATTLTVGSRHLPVGPAQRTVRVPVPPGTATTVTLRLRLGRGRLASTSTVVLARR